MEPDRGFMRAFRQVLVTRGFPFCDEGEPEQPQFPPPSEEGQAQGGGAVEPLLLAGVEASSVDSPDQGIDRTLDDSAATFWSSTGSQSPEADEYLLYKLKSPLCLLRHVQLIVFRAHYQFGEPIYPPAHVSFQVGPSPWSLAPPSLKYPVAATDAVQTFPLPADLPLGRYLRVNLHSKRQQQLEDMQWYLAVQRVEAFGSQLAAGDVALLRDWTARQQRPLPAPGALPSYVAAAVLGQLQQQPQQAAAEEGEHEQQQAQEREPAGEVMQGHEGPAAAAAPGGGEAGLQQAQQSAAAAAAAAGILRQQSLESTTSSLSFTG